MSVGLYCVVKIKCRVNYFSARFWMLLLLLHYSSTCSDNNNTTAWKCKHHCLFYSTVVTQTGHKQTGTCLCLRCNSECIVFGKVVQVQLVPERESRMEDKTTVMTTTGCQIHCRTRQQWGFFTTNHLSFFCFNWLVRRVSDNSNMFQTWGHFPLLPSGSKRHWRWSLPLAFGSPSFSPGALSARPQQSRMLAGLTCISSRASICIHGHALQEEFWRHFNFGGCRTLPLMRKYLELIVSIYGMCEYNPSTSEG